MPVEAMPTGTESNLLGSSAVTDIGLDVGFAAGVLFAGAAVYYGGKALGRAVNKGVGNTFG